MRRMKRSICVAGDDWQYELIREVREKLATRYIATRSSANGGPSQNKAINEAHLLLLLYEEGIPSGLLGYISMMRKKVILAFIKKDVVRVDESIKPLVQASFHLDSPEEVLDKLEEAYPTLREEMEVEDEYEDVSDFPGSLKEVGDYIEYGVYPQEKASLSEEEISHLRFYPGHKGYLSLNGKDLYFFFMRKKEFYKATPIRWKTLKKESSSEGEVALALSESSLDSSGFDEYSLAEFQWEREWEDRDLGQYGRSIIRQFANGDFLDDAFLDDGERLVSDESGDKVSIIGKDLLEEYFPNKMDRIAPIGEYGVFNVSGGRLQKTGGAYYWIKDGVALSPYEGGYYRNGYSVDYGFRPLILVKIK